MSPTFLEPSPAVLPEGTAKITYTSGSTGAPKGVCLSLGQMEAVAASLVEVIGAALEGLGLATRFDAVVSAASLSDGKPHPAVYLAAAAELGVDPGNCIAFEDSVAGVRSAKGAGMYTVAVPEEHNRGRAEYGIADLELGSLEEFPERLLVDPG